MLTQIGKNAKKAERVLMTAPLGKRDRALREIAFALRENSSYIIAENKKDLEKIPPYVLEKFKVVTVREIREVLDTALKKD